MRSFANRSGDVEKVRMPLAAMFNGLLANMLIAGNRSERETRASDTGEQS